MPARAPRRTPTPAVVSEPTAPTFDEPPPPPPANADADATVEAPTGDAPAPRAPSGYRGLKVWQRAMDLAATVFVLTRGLPKIDQDGLGAELRRSAVQVPAYVAAGNSLFQRTEYLQYLGAAHGALARLEATLHVADRLGHLPATEGASVLVLAADVGRLLRALTRSMQPGPASPADVPSRPARATRHSAPATAPAPAPAG